MSKLTYLECGCARCGSHLNLGGQVQYFHPPCNHEADLARAVEQEREECCKAECVMCEAGMPVIHKPEPEFGPDWWHPDEPGMMPCDAANIRDRSIPPADRERGE